MSEPIAPEENTFEECKAAYGTTFATEGYELELNTTTVNIFATSEYIPPLNVTLLDFYGQRVSTESTSTVFMSAVFVEGQCIDEGYLTGGTSEIFDRGIAIFDNVEVFCQPDSHFNASLSSTSRDFDVQLPFRFFLADCVMGEIRDGNLCVRCPIGFYSFDPTATACLECPDESYCPGGSVIDINSGYWRQTQTSHDVLPCPNPDSCLGGSTVEDQCRNGHEGLLCEYNALLTLWSIVHYFVALSCVI